MEGATHLISHGIFPGKQLRRFCATAIASSVIENLHCGVFFGSPKMMQRSNNLIEVHAVRRRRVHMKSETYVILEPGKAEEFVSEDELKLRLKDLLENWPNGELPPDLARFSTIDDVVTHLVKSVCELEIDGEVGSVQWYQVQLE